MKEKHGTYIIFSYGMSLVLALILYLAFHYGIDIHVWLDALGKLAIILSTTLLVFQSSLLFIELTLPILVALTFLISSSCIQFLIFNSYKSYPRLELGISIIIVTLGYFFILNAKRNHKIKEKQNSK